MLTEAQIRQRLAAFLENRSSLDELEDWLVQHSWNMHKDSEPLAQELAAAVELRLAEHSSEHLTEAALREELAELISGRPLTTPRAAQSRRTNLRRVKANK
jgi:hypothetical protein